MEGQSIKPIKNITIECEKSIYKLTLTEKTNCFEIILAEDFGCRSWKQVFKKEDLEKSDPRWIIFDNTHQLLRCLTEEIENNKTTLEKIDGGFTLIFYIISKFGSVESKKEFKLRINTEIKISLEDRVDKLYDLLGKRTNTNVPNIQSDYLIKLPDILKNFTDQQKIFEDSLKNIQNELKLLSKKSKREAGAGEIIQSESDIEEEDISREDELSDVDIIEDSIIEEKKEKKISKSVYEENILLQYNKVQSLNVQELTFNPSPISKTTIDSLVKFKSEFVIEKESRWGFSYKNKKIKKLERQNELDKKTTFAKINGQLTLSGKWIFTIKVIYIAQNNQLVEEDPNLWVGFRQFENGKNVGDIDKTWMIGLFRSTPRRRVRFDEARKKALFKQNDRLSVMIDMDVKFISVFKNDELVVSAKFKTGGMDSSNLYPCIGLVGIYDQISLVD
jgi:hypothetical protein